MKKFPEFIVLAATLGLLALGAASMAYLFPSLEDITGVSSTEPSNKHLLQKLKAEDLESSLAVWNSPVLWNEPEDKHRLFISDGFLFYASLYPNGDFLRKFDASTRTPSGVLISWYQKYGLDFTNPDVDREDPDGDGFSNIVEFTGTAAKAQLSDGSTSTNPLDPHSHPSYLSRLRLDKYETKPFRITFRGYQKLGNETLFQIYLKDVPSDQQPRLKKVGDDLGYEGYKITAFRQKIVNEKMRGTGIDVPTDESELDLERPDIDFKITLPYRKEIDSPESTADFVMLMPAEVGKEFKVPIGKILVLSELPDQQFQVRIISDTGATIRDVKTKQDYTVLKLDPNEWNYVPAPPPPSAPKSP